MSKWAYSTEGFDRIVHRVDGIETVTYAIGAGEPLVYFHGGGTFHGFEWVRPLASEFRVFCPYHPNFGESGDAPFDQMADVIGPGHQVHHKFIVCGFNSPDAVVYCGSSTLALGGEQNNGYNLIAIHDRDVATVFAIEALELVDHFNFLDQFPKPKGGSTSGSTTAAPGSGFLSTTDKWVDKFFDPNDLRSMDRKLFG